MGRGRTALAGHGVSGQRQVRSVLSRAPCALRSGPVPHIGACAWLQSCMGVLMALARAGKFRLDA